jgi:hypothetical protein
MRVPVGARRRPLQPLDETGAPEEAEPPRWPASGGTPVAGGTPAIPTIGGLLAAATAGRLGSVALPLCTTVHPLIPD